VIFGDNLPERTKEAVTLADLLAAAMKDPTPATPDLMRSNLIALGDFNIEKADARVALAPRC
jgi:hypothetical protein